MTQLLLQKLHHFLVHNNPDVLVQLQSQTQVTAYLEQKVQAVEPLLDDLVRHDAPTYLIEELCMQEMTAELRPSKYNLLTTLLAEHFEELYVRMVETGTLTFEIINLLSECEEVFQSCPLTEENEDDRFLHYALIGCIEEYLHPWGPVLQ